MGYLKKSVKALSRKFSADRKTVFIIILGAAGVLLLVLSELIPSSPKEQKTDVKTDTAVSSADYEKSLEERLAKIISDIDGAGEVSVMVTLESGTESVFAQDEKRSGAESGGQENEYVIIKNDDGEGGVLLKTSQPRVRGVAVVCTGGGSAVVRQSILNTVTAVLGISSARVNISVMKRNNGG